MANALYGLGREKFLTGSIDWSGDTIKVSLVTTSYTLVINTDEFFDDIPGGAVVASSSALGSKTTTLGVADAADVTFSAVSGSQAAYLIGWKDTGVASTSPLIFAIDVATGLPVTPNGGDITVQWDNGSNKIFKLFQGLDHEEKGRLFGFTDKIKDFLRGLKIPAEKTPSGLWIPSPKIVQIPKLGLA